MFTITYRVAGQNKAIRAERPTLVEARELMDLLENMAEVHTIMFFDNNCDLIEVF